MAVGDGGFKTVAVGGFDKNEVNTYIADLRKKMKSIEEDMRANNKKTEEALKLADEADDRIKQAEKEAEGKIAEVNKQLSVERERAAKFKDELEAMKKELESERKKMSDMLISGKGVSAEAQKAYADVIDKANADAADIIAKANEKAAAVIAQADEQRADMQSRAGEFLETLKQQLDTITNGYKVVSGCAAGLLGTELAPIEPVELPEVTAVPAAPAAPAVEQAAAEAAEEPAEEAAPEAAPEAAEEAPAEAAEEPAAEEAPVEEPAAPEAAEVPEVSADNDGGMPDAAPDGEFATFDDAWGGNELAQTIYNNEKENAVPLVNPNQKNLFGDDLFKGDDSIKVEELTGEFEPEPGEEIVEEIKPLDTDNVGKVDYNDNFDNDLLSQTMPSGSINDVSESMLDALKAAEAAFAVQPSITELDMDEPAEQPAESSEDDLMKALREAEEALNSMAPPASVSMDEDESAAAPEPIVDNSSNPWADLQKQLEAMEQSGAVSAEPAAEEPEPVAMAPADPAAPSADDSSIWDFGSTGGDSSDDDMSGDMFGGFGGF